MDKNAEIINIDKIEKYHNYLPFTVVYQFTFENNAHNLHQYQSDYHSVHAGTDFLQ